MPNYSSNVIINNDCINQEPTVDDAVLRDDSPINDAGIDNDDVTHPSEFSDISLIDNVNKNKYKIEEIEISNHRKNNK